MKKKNILPGLSLILAAASLAVSCLAWSAVPEDQTHLINDLYQENTRLQAQVDALSARLDQQQRAMTLRDWTLDVEPWPDSTGAQVRFCAMPASYSGNENARLVVYLNGVPAAETVCVWDGVYLSAEVSLSAADGYSYYLQLGSGGEIQTLPLMTAAEDQLPVNLAAGLTAYCNLVVGDWSMDQDALHLASVYAQVQLPRMGASGPVELHSAQLVLRCNGQELSRQDVAMEPSEVSGSLNATLEALELPVGLLQEGDVLELCLEVTLSDGRNLSAFGISWTMEKGELISAVG